MASKRNVRKKSCSNKIKYVSIVDAKKAAYHARERTSEWIIEYGCKFCWWFHIGHPPKHVQRAIKARSISRTKVAQ